MYLFSGYSVYLRSIRGNEAFSHIKISEIRQTQVLPSSLYEKIHKKGDYSLSTMKAILTTARYSTILLFSTFAVHRFTSTPLIFLME